MQWSNGVGLDEGAIVGADGEPDGLAEGELLGDVVGAGVVGLMDGESLGDAVGNALVGAVGVAVGAEGQRVGPSVGAVGAREGDELGPALGTGSAGTAGDADGLADGSLVGDVGDRVGTDVGKSVGLREWPHSTGTGAGSRSVRTRTTHISVFKQRRGTPFRDGLQ